MNNVKEFVSKLREKEDIFAKSGCAVDGLVKDYKKAAEIIEELLEKPDSANMSEFVEKLIERLEEERHSEILGGWPSIRIERAIEIVNRLAEEYNQDLTKNNQGWILCSERLPAQQEESDGYRYRKKPIEIEAFQYDGDLKGNSGYYVPEWAVKAFEEGIMYYDSLEQEEPPCELFIKTLEGNHHVSVNDYVIQGVNGELYPCKPDIFEKTYEKVTEPQKEIPTKHYEERFNRVM